MKPQRFSIGQAVTRKAGINPTVLDDKVVSPRQGEIYHVRHYWDTSTIIKSYPNEWYIGLCEMPFDNAYLESTFEPVDLTNKQIAELVEEALTEKV